MKILSQFIWFIPSDMRIILLSIFFTRVINIASASCTGDSSLDVVYVTSRSSDLNPFYYACESTGEFSSVLRVINQTYQFSRTSIVSSSTTSNYTIVQPFTSDTNITGFHSSPTSDADIGFSMQTALMSLKEGDLGWRSTDIESDLLTHPKIQRIVVIITSNPSASNTGGKFSSSVVAASIFHDFNCSRLIILAQNKQAYEGWTQYVNEMTGIISEVHHFNGYIREFYNLMLPAIDNVVCGKPSSGGLSLGVAIALTVAGVVSVLPVIGYGTYLLVKRVKSSPPELIIGEFEGEENLDHED